MDKFETPVKAYTQFQLIEMYGVTRNVFMAWLEDFKEELGPLKGKCYTRQQIRIIFSKIDPPS